MARQDVDSDEGRGPEGRAISWRKARRPSSEWTSETRGQRARRARLDAERRQLEHMAAEGNAFAIACLAAPEEE